MVFGKLKSQIARAGALGFVLSFSTYVGAAGVVPGFMLSSPVAPTVNANIGSLSYAPASLLGQTASQSMAAGMQAARGLLNFQPQVPVTQVLYGLPVSQVDANGFWNGMGQMPGMFVAPWFGQIPAGTGPIAYDYRINTTYYSSDVGPLRQTTDGSVPPWEYGLAPAVADAFTKQGFETLNLDSTKPMPPFTPLQSPNGIEVQHSFDASSAI